MHILNRRPDKAMDVVLTFNEEVHHVNYLFIRPKNA